MEHSFTAPVYPVSMKYLSQVLAKLAPNNSTTYYNGITKQLLPFFKFLRVLGQCPFLFETVRDREGFRSVNYTFKICCDVKFVLSVLAAVFITSCSILELLHAQGEFSIFGELWPFTPNLHTLKQATDNNGGNMTKIMIELFEIVHGLLIVFEYFVVWFTSSRLSEWMNEWNNIENDMKKCPGMLQRVDLSNFWKYFVIPYILLPTIAMGTPIAMLEWNNRYPIGFLIIITSSYISTACLQIQDVKVAVMFKAIELSFKQVRQNIEMEYDKKLNFRKSIDNLRKVEVRKWQKIVIKIRKQADSAGRYLAVHQLTSIATCIFSASSALFASSNLIGEQKGNKIIPLVVIFTMISFMRVMFKISMAVRITLEERRLANSLKDLELIEIDEECQYEIKSIYEILLFCPTEISLCDFVKLNNSLVLGICGQVLTQFIVYHQFQSSK